MTRKIFDPKSPTEWEKAINKADQENYNQPNMTENEYIETSLNPFLESLVKYVGENYQINTSGKLWYRRAEENSGKFYRDILYTHKEVTENWVVEVAKDLIKAHVSTPTDTPNLVGKLNTAFGLKGYRTAEVGTNVYETKDRYAIYLVGETNGETKEIRFYKDTLALYIDFFIA